MPDAPRLLEAALRRGKRCYLPVMSRFGADRLRFRRVRKGSALSSRNAMRIPEPTRSALCPPRALSLVLLPLVGFDAHGGRLGNGGGYYDRALAGPRIGRRPRRVGYAYAVQGVDALPMDAFDVRLDAVVTERGWTRFPNPDPR